MSHPRAIAGKLARRYQCSADYLLGLTDDPAAELSAR